MVAKQHAVPNIVAIIWPELANVGPTMLRYVAFNCCDRKGGSEPHVQNFLNLAKSCILSCLAKLYNKKKSPCRFLKCKRLELKLRVFLAGQSVAMITYCVTKITPTCSPVIGQCFETMIVASIDKEW